MDRNIDLVSLPKKSFWRLSIPIVAFCIFDAIYGIVDMLWVSKISVEAFFALGVSVPFVTLIYELGDSIGQGTNSIMSRFIGSGDYESAYNALIHGMIMGNVIWIFGVVCLIFAQGVLFFINKADSYIMVFDYLVPIVVFAYIFIFVNIFSETMQAEGNSTVPTVLIIGSNLLNIVLDPIFIFNLNLGIKGAAYATVLSSFLVLIIMSYFYIGGKTKVPLSPKYFRFHTYIFVEIFKVALPNFIDDMLWCFSTSFINSVLIMTTGPIGPILFSVSKKLESLLAAPIRGFGRALMSVTGHLFGAKKFDDLQDMFFYALRISVAVMVVVMIAFFFLRDYIFGLFSVTGAETEVLLIAIFGTAIMVTLPFSMISAKMLDGFGKSLYSLLFTVIEIIFEVILIYTLFVLSKDYCVLIGLTIVEVATAAVYYTFIRYLFRNFRKEYEKKDTVKRFRDDDDSTDIQSRIDRYVERLRHRVPKRKFLIALLILLIFMGLEILSIPLRMHDYRMFASAIISLILGTVCVHLMKKLDKPKLAAVGFIGIALILLVFMGRYGYMASLFFILTGTILVHITTIVRVLRRLRLMKDDDED